MRNTHRCERRVLRTEMTREGGKPNRGLASFHIYTTINDDTNINGDCFSKTFIFTQELHFFYLKIANITQNIFGLKNWITVAMNNTKIRKIGS